MWHLTGCIASIDRNGAWQCWNLRKRYSITPLLLVWELTKKFEEFLRGTPTELLAVVKKRSLKGEFVVLISGSRLETETSGFEA